MKKLIKSELLKNRFWICILAGIIVPIAIAIMIKVQIVDRTAGFIEVPLDAYMFSILCNAYLLLIFPCFMLFLNIFYSQVEDRDNGWIMVLSCVKRTERVIMAKFIMNMLVCFIAYASFTGICCYLLRERGGQVLLTAVVVPMLYSFICYIPLLLFIQIFCIILPYLIAKVFTGIFFIILTMAITQTKWSTFYFPSFYFTVSQDLEMLGIKLISSFILIVVIFFGGARLVKKYVEHIL